jgi:hypothetical protein
VHEKCLLLSDTTHRELEVENYKPVSIHDKAYAPLWLIQHFIWINELWRFTRKLIHVWRYDECDAREKAIWFTAATHLLPVAERRKYCGVRQAETVSCSGNLQQVPLSQRFKQT